MKFNDFYSGVVLAESMDMKTALKTLGLEAGFSDADLKKAYRSASMQTHPDRGGSVAASTNVNLANDYLKKHITSASGAGRSTFADYKAKEAAARSKAEVFAATFFATFSVEMYKKYLETFTNTDLKAKTSVGVSHSTAIHAKVEFSDGTNFFEVVIYAQLLNQDKQLGSSAGVMLESVGITTSVLVNRAKHKMTQANYNRQKTEDAFHKPETLFPTAKMKKIFGAGAKEKAMKKADYLLTLKNELGATISGDDIKIPLGGGLTLFVYRMTWNRKGMYMVSQVYGPVVDGKRAKELISASFNESPVRANMDKFIDALKSVKHDTNMGVIVSKLERAAKTLEDLA
ncbi:MAG: hypothetical protein ACRC3J_05150 [Culicoidibacterales bacterium]